MKILTEEESYKELINLIEEQTLKEKEQIQNCSYPENKHLLCESCTFCEKEIIEY